MPVSEVCCQKYLLYFLDNINPLKNNSLLFYTYTKNMETTYSEPLQDNTGLYKWASLLALITIAYNIIEGVVSVMFGLEDETIALFGFGLDSFIEVISGIGIWHMIRRLRQNGYARDGKFEQQALRVTGAAFFLLTCGLAVTAAINLYRGVQPLATLWGIIVSGISIATMWALIHYKLKIGRQLKSAAILADANCTKVCIYLSVILFLSSIGYELTGIGGIDSIGAIFIAAFSFREGREAFQKAKGNMTCGCKGNCG